MKKLLIFASMTLITIQATFAQSPDYQRVMAQTVQTLDTVTSPPNLVKLTNTFERIAAKEPKEWLPYYYAAYTQVRQAFAEQDVERIDPLCDRAAQYLEQAEKLSPQNSEIYCVKAMIATARIRVDFMERGMKQVTQSNQLLKEAIGIDQENPRAYLLLGQNIAGTPEGFGGGAANARKLFEKSQTLFEHQPADVTASIEPHWGQSSVKNILQQYATSQVVK